jgi:hypothetical protein
MGRYCAVPVLTARADGPATVLVALHALARSGPVDVTDAVHLDVSGTVVHVRWGSGAEHTVDLATFVPWDGVVPGRDLSAPR